MKTVIDLTHTIKPDMPLFPGSEPPVIEPVSTIAVESFLEHRLPISSHTGTHMDAPAHILPDGATLDAYDVGYFLGNGFCIDVTGLSSMAITLDSILFAIKHTKCRRSARACRCVFRRYINLCRFRCLLYVQLPEQFFQQCFAAMKFLPPVIAFRACNFHSQFG